MAQSSQSTIINHTAVWEEGYYIKNKTSRKNNGGNRALFHVHANDLLEMTV